MAESMVQLYRSSFLCDSLMDAMEELMAEGKMDQELGMKVLANYDQSIMAALSKRAEAKASLTVRAACARTSTHLIQWWPGQECITLCTSSAAHCKQLSFAHAQTHRCAAHKCHDADAVHGRDDYKTHCSTRNKHTRCDCARRMQGELLTYNHLDNVWQMTAKDVDFRLVPRAQGALAKAPRLRSDKLRLYLVESKVVQGMAQ